MRSFARRRGTNSQQYVLRNDYKLIKNEKLKCLALKSIQPPESILCRIPFDSDYSFESSWVCLYQLCSFGFGDFLKIPPCRFTQVLSSWIGSVGEQQFSSLSSTDSQWGSSLGYSWATQGLEGSCSEAILVLLWLYAWGHYPVGT